MQLTPRRSAWQRLCLQGLALLLGAALSAQEPLAAWKPASGAASAPALELAPSTGLLTALAPAPAAHLELGYVAPPVPGALSRAALDAPATAAEAPAFDALPGGIVFGRAARPSPELAGARLVLQGERLALQTGERLFLLPAAAPAHLSVCLDFARRARPSDVAVDIQWNGTVLLAPELLDTEVGALLIAADRSPHALAGHPHSKSVIVDRDVRVTADPATGKALLAADLEVRFYRQGSAWLGPDAADCVGMRAVPAGDASDALARDLAAGAELAAWIGFFRHALATDPEGVNAVAQALAAGPAAAPCPTPRNVPLRERDAFREPSPVPDWMRAYRARGEAR
jgi:hypothetical protein